MKVEKYNALLAKLEQIHKQEEEIMGEMDKLWYSMTPAEIDKIDLCAARKSDSKNTKSKRRKHHPMCDKADPLLAGTGFSCTCHLLEGCDTQ